MKYQVLFSLKNNEKLFMNAICCGCDWRFNYHVLLGVFDIFIPPAFMPRGI